MRVVIVHRGFPDGYIEAEWEDVEVLMKEGLIESANEVDPSRFHVTRKGYEFHDVHHGDAAKDKPV